MRSLFYYFLYSLIDRYIPLKRPFLSRHRHWFSNELRTMISIKKSLHFRWKNSGNCNDLISSKKLRAQCIRLSRSLYSKYVKSVESSLSNNIHKFWDFIRNRKNDNTISLDRYWGNKSANSSLAVANIYSQYFNSVFRASILSDFNRVECDNILDNLTITSR